jgi:hypothetical protein
MPSSTLNALALTWTIYPDGEGHFALGSPDGRILQQGEAVEISLGGFRIPGSIQWSHNGDYFTAQAGDTVCGLCARMQVRVLTDSGPALDQARHPSN